MKRVFLMAALAVAAVTTAGCETVFPTKGQDGTPLTIEEQRQIAQSRCNAAGDGLFFAQNALIIYAATKGAKPETVATMQQGVALLQAGLDRVCTRYGLVPVSTEQPQGPPPLPIMR